MFNTWILPILLFLLFGGGFVFLTFYEKKMDRPIKQVIQSVCAVAALILFFVILGTILLESGVSII